MTARTTAVQVDGHRAWLTYGHVDPIVAVTLTREHYTAELAKAQRILAGIDAGRARVFHQRGIYRVSDRKQVT